jgi:hypothetical protein
VSTKTKGGILLPILLAVAGYLVVTETTVVRDVISVLGFGGEPAPTGTLVPPTHADRMKDCTPEQLTKDKRCKNLPIVPIDAAKMPYIARHIAMAWQLGQPALLHKTNEENRKANNSLACNEPRKAALKPASCDEYPFASSIEGGPDASTQGVPLSEQRIQGGTIRATYSTNNIQEGDEYLVIIVNPAKIATDAYKG